MKPAPFTYHDPGTTAEAVSLIGQIEDYRLLAGGQSLMPMMNFRYVMPEHLIDLNKIGELSGITLDGAALRFGAMTRQCDLEFSPDIGRAMPILHDALRHVGHRQTRNRGTIGGSLCHLDPSAELANMAALHGATFHARSRSGVRDLAFSEFAVGYMSHSLAPDELLAGVSFPIWGPGHGHAFHEVARRQGDFAIVAVGALLDLDSGGTIRRAALALSGLGPIPIRASSIEAALVGQNPTHETLRAAAAAAGAFEAMSDAIVAASYRQHLARILTYRAIEGAANRARQKATTTS
jgi:carbon-monoxide dehydrogenase medium subunit